MNSPSLLMWFALLWISFVPGYSFTPSMGGRSVQSFSSTKPKGLAVLYASGGKKKRRRRRKESPAVPSEPIEETTPPLRVASGEKAAPNVIAATADDEEEVDVSDIMDVAKFSFDGEIESGKVEAVDSMVTPQQPDSTALPLPDIKEALKKKEMEERMARLEEETEADKVLIKRSDKRAMLKLLEQQPYADADDSFFEEEEYGTVSALLGERAKPFLGIPPGPLQVSHFIGALVIMLMAFVDYPGFPLTNLPTPLRGALQGGLGTIFAINLVLAVFAVFKAGERGQSAILWAAKTFTVGGLAYDQLTQLPTTEQIEKAKAQKGKRALTTRNKY